MRAGGAAGRRSTGDISVHEGELGLADVVLHLSAEIGRLHVRVAEVDSGQMRASTISFVTSENLVN